MKNIFCPDFVILGFPKCGTTSLARLLDGLDRVKCAEVKEPHFFSPEFPATRPVTCPEHYRELYSEINNRMTFEASTWYSYSPNAIRQMLELNPSIKFIVCLRDPIRMLASYHQHALRRGYESVPSLKDAWNLQDERAKGMKLPENCTRPDRLEYRTRSAIGEHYSSISKLVPERQLHTVFLEDLTENLQESLADLSEYLDLPELKGQSLPRENPGRKYRSPMMKLTEKIISRSKILKPLRELLKKIGLKKVYKSLIFQKVNTKMGADERDFQKIFFPHRDKQLEIVKKVALASGNSKVVRRAELLLGR